MEKEKVYKEEIVFYSEDRRRLEEVSETMGISISETVTKLVRDGLVRLEKDDKYRRSFERSI